MSYNDGEPLHGARNAESEATDGQSVAEHSQLATRIFGVGPVDSAIIMIGRHSARQQLLGAKTFADAEAILFRYHRFVERIA